MTRFATALLSLSIVSLAACAAPTADDVNDSTNEAVKSASVTGTNASTLLDMLVKSNAPVNGPTVDFVSRAARVRLTDVQGGTAHFVSQNGTLSSPDGQSLGTLSGIGADWSAVKTAMLAGGVNFSTVQGDHGASSGTLFATVQCGYVVNAKALASCTVKPITMTSTESKSLWNVLTAANAPSNTAPGVVGVGSRIARVTVTTAQGGMAHFISEGGSIDTLDGKHLADLTSCGESWSSVRDAVLAGGGAFTTTAGDHGASSSTMSVTVTCSEVVSPSAKPSCSISL